MGYIFKRGKLVEIRGLHVNALGDIDEAVNAGCVRIRDHGCSVAFQGRSRSLVMKALDIFRDQVRLPKRVSLEWPGHYEDKTC